MITVGIVDYGMGNLRSVVNSLAHLGYGAELVRDADRIADFDKVILPGVGAFGEAMANLDAANMTEALHRVASSGRPILGICLGMQLMCRESLEHGHHRGLGWLDASVLPFAAGTGLKVPHMGWNSLLFSREDPIRTGVPEGADVYFVHSYHVRCEDSADEVAGCIYGDRFSAIVAKGNLVGMQFHPEKSQKFGLQLLRNFVERDPC